MLEIDRLKIKVREGQPLTALEGMWLVEKVNQLREALAMNQPGRGTCSTSDHPLVRQMARDRAEEAQRAATVEAGATIYPRGNESWAEWGLSVAATDAR